MSELLQHHNRSVISREDLWELMKQLHPDLSRDSIDWFVYNCQEQNIFKRIGRNRYTLSGSELDRDMYDPGKTEAVKRVEQALERLEGSCRYQVWDSGQLEEFMPDCRRLPRIVFAELEKGYMEDGFQQLKRRLNGNVWFKPERKYFKKYLEEEAVIVLPLPSEAPKHKEDVHQVRLEKLIVDLLANKLVLELLSEEERIAFCRSAFERYVVEESGLFRYARRRNKEAAVRDMIGRAGICLVG